MREPAVASALASSCVQSFLDSGDAQSEDLGRDPEALLDALIRSGVLSSLTMEVVYDILCRVALCDMDRAIMLFRGVVTRALFRKMSPLIGTPSAHYALVGQDIMNVNPGYLGICESIDAASPSTPDDIDVEHSLGVALENFPESPVLGWVAKEFSLEVPQTPRQELSQADAHLVGRLARDLTKRDGMELVLRLVDILCGASMSKKDRSHWHPPYRWALSTCVRTTPPGTTGTFYGVASCVSRDCLFFRFSAEVLLSASLSFSLPRLLWRSRAAPHSVGLRSSPRREMPGPCIVSLYGS